MFFLVFKQLFIMFLIAACGFFVTRQFKFGDCEEQFVSKILIFFINPCLIFSKFDIDFSFEYLKNFLITFVIALVLHLVMCVIAVIFCRPKRFVDKSISDIDCLSVAFTNCSFIGIPLLDGIFPSSNAVFYLLPYIVVFNVFIWTFGYRVFCGKINVSKLFFNPNIFTVILGFVLFCLPFKLPEIISIPLKHISSMNTVMAMFLLGMLFAHFKGFKKVYISHVLKVSVLRFAVVLLFALAIIIGAYKILPYSEEHRLICYVLFIASVCPVALSVSSFSVLFKKDESYSALVILVTSLLCILTIPLSVSLLDFLIKTFC